MNYLIEYSIYNKEHKINQGSIRARNKQNELDAKIKLEQYLIRKNPDMTRMIVHSCIPDMDISSMFNMFDMFK